MPFDDLPISGLGVDEEADDLEVVARTPDFFPGETQTVSAELVPGSHALICNFPGHYSSGMRIAFEVTEP